MKISAETTVRDIAREHPSSVRIFEKAGVDYCCGGTRSLHSVCESQNLDYDELLARLEAASAEAQSGTSGEQDWNYASLAELAKHIGASSRVRARREFEIGGADPKSVSAAWRHAP